MNEQLEMLLFAYLDDELDDAGRAEVAALLARSPEASERLAEMQALFTDLESLPEITPDADLAAGVTAVLEAEAPAPASRFWWLLALQAAGVLALGSFFFFSWQPTWEQSLAIWDMGRDLIVAQLDFSALRALFTSGWLDIINNLPHPPALEVSMTTWGWLIGLAFLLWLAGNRLLFTDAMQNGGHSNG